MQLTIFKLLFPFLMLSFWLGNGKPSTFQKHNSAGATISGKVTIEATTSQRRVYRGRAYRGGGTIQDENDKQSTPYENTIISAHPLSFKVDTKPLPEPVQIRQENATFIPHITPVTVGTTVQFVNNDPFYHNVFSLTPGAKFNIGRRPTGTVVSKKIPKLTGEVKVAGIGEIQLFCDIHSQMNAQILSLDTPYFVRVNEDGTYKLTDLPAGTYELRAYNSNFETSSIKVTVKKGEEITQNFNFSN